MKVIQATEIMLNWRHVLDQVQHHQKSFKVQRYGIDVAIISPTPEIIQAAKEVAELEKKENGGRQNK